MPSYSYTKMGCLMCTEPPPVNYSSIRNSVKTGDILLFSGKGWQSLEVKIGTCSNYSHIGMVIRMDGEPYLWHSSGAKITFEKDLFTSKYKDGPQMNTLYNVLRKSTGKVYYRRLTGPRFIEVKADENLMNFLHKTSKKSYETDMVELLKSAYDGPGGENEENRSSYFCSELVADTMVEMGILGDFIITNEFVPSDFASRRNLDNGFKLGPIKRIVV